MKNDMESQADSLAVAHQDFEQQTAGLLRAGVRSWRNKGWLFTGCGTTYALALTTAFMFNRAGISATALPASEIAFYPELIPAGRSILVPFSRSGETSETIWAVDAFRQQQPDGKVVAVTASPDASLCRLADLSLRSAVIHDTSTVETKSFSGMLYLAQLLSAWIGEDINRLQRLAKLPEYMKALILSAGGMASPIGANPVIDRFFFLGSGEAYGLACQAAFMMKECSAEWAEGYHPLEFRHGPRTNAVKGALVCLFLGDDQRATGEELRVIKEMSAQGAMGLVLYERSTVGEIPQEDGITCLDLKSGLAMVDRLPAYLPLLQWIAYERTLARSLDPDHPANLKAVTKL